jgi:subtilisin family serine protease
VSAPGLNVITAYPNGYAVASGTSFSAPFVAAEAALIRSLTTQNTEAIIARSSVNINRQNPSYAGQLGNGRVDLSTAVGAQ